MNIIAASRGGRLLEQGNKIQYNTDQELKNEREDAKKFGWKDSHANSDTHINYKLWEGKFWAKHPSLVYTWNFACVNEWNCYEATTQVPAMNPIHRNNMNQIQFITEIKYKKVYFYSLYIGLPASKTILLKFLI